MTDNELIHYVLLQYLDNHPAAEGAIVARLTMLEAGTYIPANDPQAGPVIQNVTAFLNNVANVGIPALVQRLQTLSQQNTPVPP